MAGKIFYILLPAIAVFLQVLQQHGTGVLVVVLACFHQRLPFCAVLLFTVYLEVFGAV
jgi:hypothetical protein